MLSILTMLEGVLDDALDKLVLLAALRAALVEEAVVEASLILK